MSDRYFGNELDNQLYEAILSENKPQILEIIKSGANINAIDKYGDNMITNYLRDKDSESDIEIIKYLIELGIDINHESEGFNCLFNVYLANRSDIFEYLIEKGASVNCISTDTSETLLDWIEWDIDFEKEDSRASIEWINESEKILQLLKSNGAIYSKDCFAEKVEEYLKMFGGINTGLFTKNGYIHIHDIPNITDTLVEKFNNWHKIDNSFIDKTWNREEIDIENLRDCNNKGLEISKAIKELLPDNIKVQFNYIIPEDYQKKKARNIKELTI